MNKKIKNLLAIISCLFLVGCGQKDNNSDKKDHEHHQHEVIPSLRYSGELTKKEYHVGEYMDFSGLMFYLEYSEDNLEIVTDKTTPNPVPLYLGQTQVMAICNMGENNYACFVTGFTVIE